MNNIKLIKGDCLEKMDELIEKGIKIDLTITSPPYDDLRSYNNSLKWNFDIFKKVADRLYDITTNGGIVVWIVGDKTKNGSETGTSFEQALYFKEIGFNIHDIMIYSSDKPPLSHNRYEQKFEYMFILSKGKPKTFNPIMEECKYAGTNKRARTFRHTGEELEETHNKGNVKDEKIKGNIWFYSTGYNKSTKDKIAFKHPAIFPEQLVQDHILTWSNEGDLILDCFMGSNTTGKIALKNNRRFIGIEKVDEYFDISKERVNIYIKENNLEINLEIEE